MSVPSPLRRTPLALVGGLAVLVVVVVGIRRVLPNEGRSPDGGALRAAVRFWDDFSSGSGWATLAGESETLRYEHDGYRLLLSRPRDDAMSILTLPGGALPSVAAAATVMQEGPFGGLVGVGCANTRQRAYLAAVDPAGFGFAILRVSERGMALLRYGINDQGAIRGIGQANEVQIQCSAQQGRRGRTSIRLFAGDRLLAAYDDAAGYGPFRGVALGAISLRHPVDALFTRVSLQSLAPPRSRAAPVAACDDLLVATSLQNDYRWLVESGGTRGNTPDFDTRQVVRIARELKALADRLRAGSRPLADQAARGELESLADRMMAQGSALNSVTNAVNLEPIDTSGATAALGCGEARAVRPAWHPSARSRGFPRGAKGIGWASRGRPVDERLTRHLPAPPFVPDESPPIEPQGDVEIDLNYATFRVFGESVAELNRSLRVRALHVEGELAAGLTASRFEVSYEGFSGSGGCTLHIRMLLELDITVPDWTPPVSVGRYFRNQWNQFMWDLDAHERRHAELWIEAANRMVQVVEDLPPQSTCRKARLRADKRIDEVFQTYDRLQRDFDRDVAAGRLPAPSLP